MTTRIPGSHRASGHREASARITAALAGMDFPTTKEALKEQMGDTPIPVEKGTVMPMSAVLDAVPEENFLTIARTLDMIDAHWQDIRSAAGQREEPDPAITDPGRSMP